jgi:CheY-like chemotaxis protein
MEHNILVADDSLTIQKVIKITLSNEPFSLVECTKAEELSEKVSSSQASIVLLDFNLSESKTGYDLAKEIKEVSPKIQILMLYGAFDSIDEGLLAESGCAYHIVKPFDGTKFINLCRTMAQDFDSNKGESAPESDDFDFSTEEPVADIPEPITEEPATTEDVDDWVVNQPDVIEDIPEPIEEEVSAKNHLDQSIEDWGMEVPSIIGEDDSSAQFPDVIEDAGIPESELPASIEEEPIADIPEPIEATTIESGADEITLPSNDDLEYPDMSSPSPVEEDRTMPSLTPASDLNNVEEPEVEVSAGGTDSEEALQNLQDEISDELEEEDLWAADEFEITTDEVEENFVDKEVQMPANEDNSFRSMDLDDLPQIEPHSLEKVIDNTIDESGPEDFPSDVMDDEPAPIEDSFPAPAAQTEDLSSFDSNLDESMDRIDEAAQVPGVSADFEEKLQKELTDKMGPIIEQFVKEYCENSIEKIAWEIIPDLAENVIKKEIQKISDSIMDQ